MLYYAPMDCQRLLGGFRKTAGAMAKGLLRMKDKIFLTRLEVFPIIGIFDWERKKKQKVWIDLEFPADARKAARHDRINDAVDYKKIAKHAAGFASRSRFYLIETLAERLAGELLEVFRLGSVRIRISKPGAVRGSLNVGVEISRKAPRRLKKPH